MTVSAKINGRKATFIPMTNEKIENGYWIYSDTLDKVGESKGNLK